MNHSLRPAYDMPKIYLYRNPVDFRNYVQQPVMRSWRRRTCVGNDLYAATTQHNEHPSAWSSTVPTVYLAPGSAHGAVPGLYQRRAPRVSRWGHLAGIFQGLQTNISTRPIRGSENPLLSNPFIPRCQRVRYALMRRGMIALISSQIG